MRSSRVLVSRSYAARVLLGARDVEHLGPIARVERRVARRDPPERDDAAGHDDRHRHRDHPQPARAAAGEHREKRQADQPRAGDRGGRDAEVVAALAIGVQPERVLVVHDRQGPAGRLDRLVDDPARLARPGIDRLDEAAFPLEGVNRQRVQRRVARVERGLEDGRAARHQVAVRVRRRNAPVTRTRRRSPTCRAQGDRARGRSRPPRRSRT